MGQDVNRPGTELLRPRPLDQTHEVAGFDCGEAELNSWLVERAIEAQRSRTANTYVACRGRRVVGYYSMANGEVAHAETKSKVRRNTPNPIPATILARLAVDITEKGHGLGRDLLIDAARKTLAGARFTAARLLIVHPLNETAAAFYEKYGFQKLGQDNAALYLPVDTLVDALG